MHESGDGFLQSGIPGKPCNRRNGMEFLLQQEPGLVLSAVANRPLTTQWG